MRIGEVIHAYVALKTSLGMSFESPRRVLEQFSREIGNPPMREVQAEAVAVFLRGRGALSATWALKYRILSGFYRFAISRGHAQSSPMPANVPKLPPQRSPYVYSVDELRRLLEATSVLHINNTPLQAPMFRMLLILLYGSGLRVGEALHLTVEDLTPAIVRKFLEHVESDRGCSGVTRNNRLAAVHSLAKFIGMRSPLHIAWATEIRAIPFKKTSKNLIGYLERAEMEALLKSPDRRTELGARDYAILLFLYNSGARADEAAGLLIRDLHLRAAPAVRILGKGNKHRLCPLWPATVSALARLIAGRTETEPVFLGRRHERMTRFGIHRLVTRYARLASKSAPSLAAKRVSPHSVRHTTAVHLLRSGVDINTIRAWLGHVSLDTTHVYAEVDMEMKATALASVDIKGLGGAEVPRAHLPSLMAFLKGL